MVVVLVGGVGVAERGRGKAMNQALKKLQPGEFTTANLIKRLDESKLSDKHKLIAMAKLRDAFWTMLEVELAIDQSVNGVCGPWDPRWYPDEESAKAGMADPARWGDEWNDREPVTARWDRETK
jgi:hypothetical protein